MSNRIEELVEGAFRDLLASGDVELIQDAGELHIAGDEWTLVLEGDPVATVIIALDDETGTPETALTEAISPEALAAMRDLNVSLEGAIISLLTASPDRFANTLAYLLRS